MSAIDEMKIDCHNHILDPQLYPYTVDTKYHPSAQEVGTEHQLHTVCDAYGVAHCLVVGPNSGYGPDNRCLLDAIGRSNGRFKGIAVVPNDVDLETLADLKQRGIVGIAINATYHGTSYYRDIDALIDRLAELDMFLQVQVEGDQLIDLLPLLQANRCKTLIDHCGRPLVAAGLAQPGFAALLSLAANGRTAVKISGLAKFAKTEFPYNDAWPYVHALVDAFSPDMCMWGSDWPFLRATERLDYGPLLSLVDKLFPSAPVRRKILWDSPQRLFKFDTAN